MKKFIERVSFYFETAGVVGIIGIFLFNFVDVVGSKVFTWPLPGAVDLIGFAHLCAIAPAISFGLIIGTHVSMDFIIKKFPRRVILFSEFLVLAVSIVFLFICFWFSIEYGYSLQKSGEGGATSNIPLYPFAYYTALCFLPALLYYLLKLKDLIRGGNND